MKITLREKKNNILSELLNISIFTLFSYVCYQMLHLVRGVNRLTDSDWFLELQETAFDSNMRQLLARIRAMDISITWYGIIVTVIIAFLFCFMAKVVVDRMVDRARVLHFVGYNKRQIVRENRKSYIFDFIVVSCVVLILAFISEGFWMEKSGLLEMYEKAELKSETDMVLMFVVVILQCLYIDISNIMKVYKKC